MLAPIFPRPIIPSSMLFLLPSSGDPAGLLFAFTDAKRLQTYEQRDVLLQSWCFGPTIRLRALRNQVPTVVLFLVICRRRRQSRGRSQIGVHAIGAR